MPTIIEPLRDEWDATYAAAIQLDESGNREVAIKPLRDYHGKLCETSFSQPRSQAASSLSYRQGKM